MISSQEFGLRSCKTVLISLNYFFFYILAVTKYKIYIYIKNIKHIPQSMWDQFSNQVPSTYLTDDGLPGKSLKIS